MPRSKYDDHRAYAKELEERVEKLAEESNLRLQQIRYLNVRVDQQNDLISRLRQEVEELRPYRPPY